MEGYSGVNGQWAMVNGQWAKYEESAFIGLYSALIIYHSQFRGRGGCPHPPLKGPK